LRIPQNWPLRDHPVGGAYCRLVTREGWAAGGSALRTWELTLALDPGLKIPLFLQLAQAVQHDIRSGRLRPGARLPGSRTLAGELGVPRNTVLAGYGELLSQGWLRTHPAGGTFVAEDLPAAPTPVPLERVRARTRLAPGFPLGPPVPSARMPDFP